MIFLRGKVSLQELLKYLGAKVRNHLNIVPRKDYQISSVLPITIEDYLLLLQCIHSKTNFKLQDVQPNIIKQKIADEGTRSEFVARLFIGILNLREAAFHGQSNTDKFDEIYHSIVMSLWEIKTTVQEIKDLVFEHTRKVSQGEIARISGASVQIDVSIDRELKKQVKSFLNEAVRVFKHEIQQLIKFFNIDMGFLYHQPDSFQTGIEKIRLSHPLLATYLYETRCNWSERLMTSRNALEHKGWQLPNINYSIKDNVIQVKQPEIADQPITEFVEFSFEQLIAFAEEITVYCFQTRMPEGVSFQEIPLTQREHGLPLRFRVAIVTDKESKWTINYSKEIFKEK